MSFDLRQVLGYKNYCAPEVLQKYLTPELRSRVSQSELVRVCVSLCESCDRILRIFWNIPDAVVLEAVCVMGGPLFGI